MTNPTSGKPAGKDTENEMFGMPDDDFGNLNGPPESPNDADGSAGAGGDDDADAGASTNTQDLTSTEDADDASDNSTDAAAEQSKNPLAEGSGEGEEPAPMFVDPTKPAASTEQGKSETKENDASKTEPKTAIPDGKNTDGKETAAANTQQFLTADQKAAGFDEIMKPFRANGRTIQLTSPEEAIQLMQMGANYTKKLQELKPHRKLLMMLENNNLLDESKLSFLIDVDRGDPEALKKLIVDSGVDPLDIDTTQNPAYVAGSHQVSDSEVNFRTELESISADPEGQKTIQQIAATWDKASKEALWESPEIMSVIHEHRVSGIYDAVAGEVDRLVTLGTIPADMPFLQAYKAVGDHMALQSQNSDQALANGTQQTPTVQQPEPKVILAERAQTPKSVVQNNDQAAAASSAPRGNAPKSTGMINPLSEKDDDFLKRMEGRL